MRYSQLFGKTKLTVPHDADSVNAKFLTQAGFVQKMAAGIYYFMPLGLRVLQKVNQIIREEMNRIGGQELLMPAMHPVELWDQTGRSKIMDNLFFSKGAGDKTMVFAGTHEEAVTPLAAQFIQSYKDLPLSVYQIQTKFRNEARAKSGILRGREFGMKDMYSFHATEADLERYYEEVKAAYMMIYKRMGLEAYVVEASGGAFTNKFSHEFSVITPAGEDTVILCKNCGTAQNLEIAEGVLKEGSSEEEKPMQEVKVAREFSIKASADAHSVAENKVLKSVIYAVEDGGFIGVCIRGDLQVNEVKLAKYLNKKVRPATPEELQKIGLVQGFISPVKNDKIEFIADKSVKSMQNYVTGANQVQLDLVNVNVGRDFTARDFVDVVSIENGFSCTQCGIELKEAKAIEAGNIFKLGTKFAKDFDLYFTDEKGERKLVQMGCYGIGNTRLVGTIVEASHDEKGIIWPKTVAPYHVHLVTLGNDEAAQGEAEKLYKALLKNGVEVLFDDRNETAGKKLNDADLIGLPLRIVVSPRTMKENAVEWKLRSEATSQNVQLTEVEAKILEFLK